MGGDTVTVAGKARKRRYSDPTRPLALVLVTRRITRHSPITFKNAHPARTASRLPTRVTTRPVVTRVYPLTQPA